jgi:hypothetical protein
MHRPRNDEAVQSLDGYEQLVNTFAENAKDYWRLWGPLGEPMVRGVDAWADMQHGYIQWLRGYIQWLRQTYGAQKRP